MDQVALNGGTDCTGDATETLGESLNAKTVSCDQECLTTREIEKSYHSETVLESDQDCDLQDCPGRALFVINQIISYFNMN